MDILNLFVSNSTQLRLSLMPHKLLYKIVLVHVCMLCQPIAFIFKLANITLHEPCNFSAERHFRLLKKNWMLPFFFSFFYSNCSSRHAWCRGRGCRRIGFWRLVGERGKKIEIHFYAIHLSFIEKFEIWRKKKDVNTFVSMPGREKTRSILVSSSMGVRNGQSQMLGSSIVHAQTQPSSWATDPPSRNEQPAFLIPWILSTTYTCNKFGYLFWNNYNKSKQLYCIPPLNSFFCCIFLHQMVSISLHTNHIVPSAVPAQTPKRTFSRNRLFLSRSSQSQFLGLNLSYCNSISTPRSAFVRNPIIAKVHLWDCAFSFYFWIVLRSPAMDTLEI